MFVYDYFLTLGMEVEFVWSSRWGFMKVLYLLQRYLPFLDSVGLCLMRECLTNPLQFSAIQLIGLDYRQISCQQTSIRGSVLLLKARAVVCAPLLQVVTCR